MKASLARCRSHPDELERTENMKLIRSGTAKSASFICIALLALLVGCKGPTKLKHFPVSGEVMAKSVSSQEITLRHGDVPGFMAAMTMDYSLPNAAVLDELQPGDRIAAQIAVDPADESHFWLEDVVITAEVARKRAARPEPSP
jgi:Cu/Ag efflux protein CusF